ncbi:MAG TPA: glycoside hydrolase family 88 protein [Spirochaetia bacterium]|nr:glycoside hydrolase family 88 protein [Spirochaetia bacterium]
MALQGREQAGPPADPEGDTLSRVKTALLSMQRYSWEQGVAAQAFLELGEADLVVLMAREAVNRQLADGRLAVMGNLSAVTDPAAIGEAVLFTAKRTGDLRITEAAERLLHWLLRAAPRTSSGVLYHLHDRPQVWVDSLYMAPPFLSAAGHHDEALKQIAGMRTLLLDSRKRLLSHIWDEGTGSFGRKAFWGVGNGWALAGMTRVIRTLPDAFRNERETLVSWVREGVDASLPFLRQDGLFHDVVDDPSTFVETNFAQMLSYVLYRGMAAGWLGAGYRQSADAMRRAAHAKVDSSGLVQGVCASPYFDRPGTAPEGQAFFLLMEAAERDFQRGEDPTR